MKKIFFALSIFVCSSHSNSFNILDIGFDIGLDFEARLIAGLDPATRRLIEKMPEKIREEVIQTLIDGLPLVDKSIHSYIDKIDHVTFNRIEQTRCSASGLIQQVPADLKEVILGIEATPIMNIVKKYNALDQKITKNSSPDFYRIQYIEYKASADKTVCQFPPQSQQWNFVQEYADKSLDRFNIWNRLHQKCNNLYDCYAKLHQDISSFLKQSNPQDLKTGEVQAQERFTKLPTPSRFNSQYAPEGIFFKKIAITKAETHLAELFSIYDQVNIIRTVREEKERKDQQANKMLEAHAASFQANQQKITDVYNTRGDTVKRLIHAKDQLLALKKLNTLLIPKIKEAETLTPFETTKTRTKNFLQEIDTSNSQVDLHIKSIDESIKIIYKIIDRDPPICKNPKYC